MMTNEILGLENPNLHQKIIEISQLEPKIQYFTEIPYGHGGHFGFFHIVSVAHIFQRVAPRQFQKGWPVSWNQLSNLVTQKVATGLQI